MRLGEMQGVSMNSTASPARGVITLAYGHKRFIEQARSLGHSLQLHAPALPRTLVTDSTDPQITKLFTNVIPYRPEYGSGVRQKLYLDQYSPYDETLFIDSDCLVLGNLDSFWAAFRGQFFAVPGFRHLKKGETDPFFNVDDALQRFNLSSIPKFNGGTYYFDRSPEAQEFFKTARHLLENAKSFGLGEFRRNGPADETLYSLAMAIHGIGPTWMGAGGMWTPVNYRGKLSLDAIAGSCSFEKEGRRLSPEIVHFPGDYLYAFPYARERARLKKKIEGRGTSPLKLGIAFAAAMLWQCSRRSAGLAKLGRVSVRAYRQLSSKAARG
jgi:hypothetical protein